MCTKTSCKYSQYQRKISNSSFYFQKMQSKSATMMIIIKCCVLFYTKRFKPHIHSRNDEQSTIVQLSYNFFKTGLKYVIIQLATLLLLFDVYIFLGYDLLLVAYSYTYLLDNLPKSLNNDEAQKLFAGGQSNYLLNIFFKVHPEG